MNNSNVIQFDYHGGSGQLWRFIPAGNGYYYIQSKLGLYLDVAGKAANSTNIRASYFSDKDNQRFKLSAVAAPKPSFPARATEGDAPSKTNKYYHSNITRIMLEEKI